MLIKSHWCIYCKRVFEPLEAVQLSIGQNCISFEIKGQKFYVLENIFRQLIISKHFPLFKQLLRYCLECVSAEKQKLHFKLKLKWCCRKL